MKPWPDQPKVVPGSTTVTEQMAVELEQRFGFRYRGIANQGAGMNRKQRRAMKRRKQDLG